LFDLGSAAYDACMTPLEVGALAAVRAHLITRASGRVLEVGAGTGVNLPYYDFSKIEELIISDLRIKPRLAEAAAGHQRVTVVQADAEALPFVEGVFDTVVATLVLCSVRSPDQGLAELARVLRPEGRLLFIEHVVSHHPVAHRLMNFANPGWRLLAGGCNINRDTARAIEEAGFRFVRFARFGRGLGIAGIAMRARVEKSPRSSTFRK